MKDFIDLKDVTIQEMYELLSLAIRLKLKTGKGIGHRHLEGRTLAMVFAKPSTRTRVSFEVGMYQLGGQALFLSEADLQTSRGETLKDTAEVLSRYVDGIMFRTASHADMLELAEHSSVPVINALTDLMHPCQAFADLMTVYERKGRFKGLKLAFLGDGGNVANSLVQACPKFGVDIAVASPKGYRVDGAVVEGAMADASQTGSTVTLTEDPMEAASGADVVYADTWVSMGQEGDKESRIKDLGPYQVNAAVMAAAAGDAIFMHCLPGYRGLDVTGEVMDGPASAIYDQAENRLHAQKAIMCALMDRYGGHLCTDTRS
ncbi:MAG: ornithine carbamoyltransferase [Oscillospiraceae bacterium]|nr:ornithine carbamoyltransferase [Oscillospiraceae bacterium]